MKQGISIERTYDLHDRLIVRILKRRGRLTLEEVSDLLRLEGGGEWSDANQNVETLLASMMEETRRMIAASSKEDGRVAWYWSFIGSLDMARQLGLITEERRQELYEKAKEMKP